MTAAQTERELAEAEQRAVREMANSLARALFEADQDAEPRWDGARQLDIDEGVQRVTESLRELVALDPHDVTFERMINEVVATLARERAEGQDSHDGSSGEGD